MNLILFAVFAIKQALTSMKILKISGNHLNTSLMPAEEY